MFISSGDPVKHEVSKGRGATLQIEGRFENVARELKRIDRLVEFDDEV